MGFNIRPKGGFPSPRLGVETDGSFPSSGSEIISYDSDESRNSVKNHHRKQRNHSSSSRGFFRTLLSQKRVSSSSPLLGKISTRSRCCNHQHYDFNGDLANLTGSTSSCDEDKIPLMSLIDNMDGRTRDGYYY